MWDIMHASLRFSEKVVSSDAPWRQVVAIDGPHATSEITTTLVDHPDGGWVCAVSAVTGPDNDAFDEDHVRRLEAMINWRVYNLVTHRASSNQT
jgi:hypothetical protein